MFLNSLQSHKYDIRKIKPFVQISRPFKNIVFTLSIQKMPRSTRKIYKCSCSSKLVLSQAAKSRKKKARDNIFVHQH